jgi:hypothetical protein
MVSANHSTAPSAFREPLPYKTTKSCTHSHFRQFVSIENSGYRTRYPPVAVTPARSAGRRGSRAAIKPCRDFEYSAAGDIFNRYCFGKPI